MVPIKIDQSNPYRSHTCAELRRADVGKAVRLAGWIHNIRDLGGVLFLELRDNFGLTQLTVAAELTNNPTIKGLRKEYVVSVRGEVVARGSENVNSALETGEIEIRVAELQILNTCEDLPFSVFPEQDVSEELRLKYRFIDLRRLKLHNNILLRSKIISSIRQRMIQAGFHEFQTPILTSSSPEGARDFLVPSRLHPGKFYALPQAPQQFKQILMMAGFDRYFQIAPCFRDEDARADRSPGEFYQLDVEMSFVTQEDVFNTIEQVLHGLFSEFSQGKKVSPAPFQRIPYETAITKYGSDKPDLRNPLELKDLTGFFKTSSFRAFAGKIVSAVAVPKGANQPRSFFDKLDSLVKEWGGEGLAWFTVESNDTLKGPLAKFIEGPQVSEILKLSGVGTGDAVLLYANVQQRRVAQIMGQLRNHLGVLLDCIAKGKFEFCWITDFPMYDMDEQTGATVFSHNPFSMPQGGLEALNSKHPLEIKAFQYDIVCNGVELSSGAIRNHQPEIMYRAFEIAGYSKAEVDQRFGGMIRALQLGAPPHGGLAPGIDRIVMLLAEESNLREVIAFPMNQKAQDLMMGAPCEVSDKQLRELHIQLTKLDK